MRTRLVVCLTVLLMAATATPWGQSQPPAQTPPSSGALSFKSSVNLVLVDVNVRDKNGAPVKGLKASDFEITESGKSQDIVSFAYEEVAPSSSAIVTTATLSKVGGEKGAVPVTIGSAPKAGAAPKAAAALATSTAAASSEANATPIDASTGPLTTEQVAGHRVWILLFDTSSMAPEDVQKAADSAIKWAKEKMSASDLVAVAAISSTLQVLNDFTNDKAKILTTLQAFSVTDGTAVADVDASTMSSDEAANTATSVDTTVDASAQELSSFNNDLRFRGMKTICDGMLHIEQHKAILYFSSGMARNGSDNQVEMRSAENACQRANVSINPVDSRGLQAVVPGGNGRQGSRGGVGAFSGRNVAAQFTQLAAQQETLQTLAGDTGGTAFTDSNDFGEAFDKVEKDISSYYILGYASSNLKKDGAYREIKVRLRKDMAGVKLNAREGYYADRDFTHTASSDRETQLQEQLLMAIPATDVPLFVTAGYFRLASIQACPGAGNGRGFAGRGGLGGPGGGPGAGGGPGGGGPGGPGGGFAYEPSCFYVPISLAVPGESVPPSLDKVTLDVRGYIRDERGEPFATIKDTLTVPPGSKDTLASKQVLYQTGTTLPPGRYSAKIVVRENTTGQMGTFEMPITVPNLARSPVKVSSLVLSTQLLSAVGRKTVSPLVRDNVEIVPNLTHVVNQDQKLYFYYEVYDPTVNTAAPQPHVSTSLAFYRGKVKVYETAVVDRTALDAPDRKAAIFQFEVPADMFKPGLYTCQVNVIDEVARTFAFPRLDMYVRASEKTPAAPASPADPAAPAPVPAPQ